MISCSTSFDLPVEVSLNRQLGLCHLYNVQSLLAIALPTFAKG